MSDREDLFNSALARYRAMRVETLVTVARMVGVSVASVDAPPPITPELEALLVVMADRMEDRA